MVYGYEVVDAKILTVQNKDWQISGGWNKWKLVFRVETSKPL